MWDILFVLLSLLFFSHIWQKRSLYKLSWQMPGPSLWFINKNYKTLLLKEVPRGSLLLNVLEKCMKTFKTPFRCWSITSLYVVVKKPEDLKIILNSQSCLNRGHIYDFMKDFIGKGIITLHTPQWNVHRKLLNPAFSPKIIRSFLPIFNEKSKVLVSHLEELCNKEEPTDICMYTKAMSYDAIYHTTLSKEVNTQKNQNFELLEWSDKVIAIISQRIFNPLLHWNSIYRLTSLYSEEKKGVDILQVAIKEAVDERKSIWRENLKVSQSVMDNNENEKDLKTPQIFIDQLMKLLMVENKFNEQEVIGEASTIIAAGYETTGVTSAYCILMLAMFPHYQDKVYEEIKSISTDKSQDVQYEDLSQCKLIDRFIKETLRLFPSIPILCRKVTESVKLGKYTIPAETNVICSIYHLHRDKETWGQTAEDFDPDRFLPENMEKMHHYAYLPFAGGPRNCIGMKYAHMFLKTVLMYAVRNFKFRTDLQMKGLYFEVDLSLNLINKHMIYIEKREY